MLGEVVVPPARKLEDLIRLSELCVDLLRGNEEFYAEVSDAIGDSCYTSASTPNFTYTLVPNRRSLRSCIYERQIDMLPLNGTALLSIRVHHTLGSFWSRPGKLVMLPFSMSSLSVSVHLTPYLIYAHSFPIRLKYISKY